MEYYQENLNIKIHILRFIFMLTTINFKFNLLDYYSIVTM